MREWKLNRIFESGAVASSGMGSRNNKRMVR